MAEKKTILLMPPDGARVRTVRIRLRYLVVAVVILLVGFAGYVIPFNRFTSDVVDQTQRKNLSEQNKQVLQRVIASFKLVTQLRGKVSSLEAQKASIEAGLKSATPPPAPARPARSGGAPVSGLKELDSLVGHDAASYERLAEKIGGRAASFDSIPVMKPVPGFAVISAVFGKQRDPFTGTVKWHYGIDFSAPQETPVVATASGVVESVAEDRQWGKRVEISHGTVFSTVYAHLGTVLVGPGAHVKRGETIATIGLTGLTRGPHLHYEIHQNGQPVDPAGYFFPDSMMIDTTLRSAER